MLSSTGQRGTRVVLACQRCKGKKQKVGSARRVASIFLVTSLWLTLLVFIFQCDGEFPSCSKCAALGQLCEYRIPDKPMPFGKNQYIKELERRVRDLEAYIAQQGMNGPRTVTSSCSVQPRQRSSSTAGLETEVGTLPGIPWPAVTAPEPHGDKRKLSVDDADVDSMTHILRDLSLDANGGYIGASSYITMGRLIGHIVQDTPLAEDDEQAKRPRPSRTKRGDQPGLQGPSSFDPAVLDQLMAGYMKYVATRWPVIHSTWLRSLHDRALAGGQGNGNNLSLYEFTMLHLAYAVAGEFLQTAGKPADLQPHNHYMLAQTHVGEVLQYRDTRSVSALMLLALYSLRTCAGVGAWAYCRLAMLLAIDLGLHRKASSHGVGPLEAEMRKRIFWSCYAFDIQVSMPLGRPPTINVRDIDASLPAEIDEAVSDPTLITVAASKSNTQFLGARDTSTSMSAYNHIVRIRRIESEIQQTVYRVDHLELAPRAVVEKILHKLSIWQAGIPKDAYRVIDDEEDDEKPFDGVDYYMIFFWKCVRLLLYPQMVAPQPDKDYVKSCAAACGSLCQTYKRLHQSSAIAYSMMSLQSVFMAGITLIYCVWLSPLDLLTATATDDIAACGVVLFVMVERIRTRAAKKYCNAFELIRQRVLSSISKNDGRTVGARITTLQSDLQSEMCRFGGDDTSVDFSQMIKNMSGEQFQASWDKEEALAQREAPRLDNTTTSSTTAVASFLDESSSWFTTDQGDEIAGEGDSILNQQCPEPDYLNDDSSHWGVVEAVTTSSAGLDGYNVFDNDSNNYNVLGAGISTLYPN
ncbi:hypothetical protein ABEF95_003901 [Exophiala dermatitidis]